MKERGVSGGRALSEGLVLRTALGRHDHVAPLRDGTVRSDRLRLEMIDFDPLPKAFRQMVRGEDLDVSEMAIVTHLLAHRYEKPITGLAIPLWSRPPHVNLVCRGDDAAIRGPKDLEGTKVGVRAYAQTSGVWVRGVLATQYDVDLDRIAWVTMEDAHLAEYDDPPGAVRNASPLALRPLMMAGELSAIMGERVVDPEGIRPVIADAERVSREWSKAVGITPINHVLTVRTALLREHPWLGAELMRMFEESRRIAVEERGAAAPPPYGFEANRASLQMAFDFSADQRITERRIRAEDLFEPL